MRGGCRRRCATSRRDDTSPSRTRPVRTPAPGCAARSAAPRRARVNTPCPAVSLAACVTCGARHALRVRCTRAAAPPRLRGLSAGLRCGYTPLLRTRAPLGRFETIHDATGESCERGRWRSSVGESEGFITPRSPVRLRPPPFRLIPLLIGLTLHSPRIPERMRAVRSGPERCAVTSARVGHVAAGNSSESVRSKAATTVGSKCAPAERRSSAAAAWAAMPW